MTDELHVTIRPIDGSRAVIGVSGALDLRAAPTLRRHALKLIEQGQYRLLIDMAGLGFCDSAGLSALIGIWHGARGAGGELLLAGVPDRLMRMLKITGVDTVLPVHPTVDDALARVAD
ncbi:STAS domain-containing protein [Streptomyces sp. CB03238]|uniref:STAS domain-containing protein n=1 Tax=Streptomyces sp. CB03238 TaxID=1907777 RepID=UPI0015C473B8|nr:STAS domain-containing protein [Streptomyces sp. CB03238]